MKFIEASKKLQELRTTNNSLPTSSIISMVGKINRPSEEIKNANRERLPVSPR